MDEVIRDFNKHNVRYLIIGAQAIRLYGMPRFSFDWDVFLPSKDQNNFNLINKILEDELDMPVLPLGPRGENFVQTYQTRYGVLQFHLIGPGFPKFDEAETRAVTQINENGTSIRCVSPSDLLMMKQAADRPQDQADIQYLKSKVQGQ